MRRSLFVFPVLFAGLLSACSSDDDGGDGTNGGGSATACSADTRKDIYTQGMSKVASDLKVAIVDSAFTPSSKPAQPGQVQKGMNAIKVSVTDAAGAPVDGAQVTLQLWMPDHGHGSAAAPAIAPMGNGEYQISNVWLPMAGLWRFTIQVNQGGQLKTTDFNFCLDG